MCLPKEMIFKLFLFAKFEKKSKKLSSLFNTIVPFFLMLKIISDLAKSEIIFNIRKNGTIVLNKDDNFFDFFSNLANKNNLNIISFGKHKNSNIRLSKLKKSTKSYIIYIDVATSI